MALLGLTTLYAAPTVPSSSLIGQLGRLAYSICCVFCAAWLSKQLLLFVQAII
jgi:hypothetical protein